MDLSALIFVALALAWACYLIPKALRHHDDSDASRAVDGFSDRMRVLARREPVDSRTARLVVQPGRLRRTAPAVDTDPEPVPTDPELVEGPPTDPELVEGPVRAATLRATRRRRRVLAVILLGLVTVGVLAGLGRVAWPWLAVPGGVLVAWLVVCRLTVRRERAVRPARRAPRPVAEPEVEEAVEADEAALGTDDGPLTEEVAVVEAELVETPSAPAEPEPAPEPVRGGWDPVPVTLPTYVAKEPAARRSVRTIDLDATGVWTSGRTAADSALAREADEQARTARDAGATAEARREAERRASGG
ncbi:hypothetical protein GCM10023340_14630 [Nocardioides marinquilinus]|uniref:Large exoprotein n=1 Tax=Nocardioides marinquilinus TaxID=1210400 RepID=A0ABP9PES6_9ACTN